MWIDTHCHLDAVEPGAAEDAAALEVACIVIPAVDPGNFAAVAALARRHANCVYALGIHPVFVPHAAPRDLVHLRTEVERAMADPRFVAIGEIGLDFFVPELCTPAMRDKQELFYREQLRIARDFDLPVLLHVRRAQDAILKHLRQIAPAGGIAHAFNGSQQQAEAFLRQGLKLGFGGAMTFARALQIRRLAAALPLDALVLETDAPDLAPAWLHPQANSPAQLPRIGAELAGLRGLDVPALARATTENARAALPRIKMLAQVPAA